MSGRKKLASTRAADSKLDYPTLENQPERLMNEAISLTSIDDSSVKLTRVGEPNKSLNDSYSFRVSTHNILTCKNGYCDRDDATTKSK